MSHHMKITVGVLSDTHLQGVTKAFQRIYDRFLAHLDVILHAGDFTSEEIVAFLNRKPFHGVHGNMDPIEVKSQLPEKRIIELGPYRLGLIHGSGPKGGLQERVMEEFQNVDVVVFGHSHRPENRQRNGVYLFNPGTAGGYTPSGFNSMGILNLEDTIHGEIIRINE